MSGIFPTLFMKTCMGDLQQHYNLQHRKTQPRVYRGGCCLLKIEKEANRRMYSLSVRKLAEYEHNEWDCFFSSKLWGFIT